MERVFNSKYRIILLNHERQESKWVIPPNEGFYIPIVLWQFLERQYGATHGLDETIRQMQFTEKQREEQRNQHFDWDDAASVSSFATNVSQQSTSGHEVEERQKRNHFDVTIQLYFPEVHFTSFCTWVQFGDISLGYPPVRCCYPVFMKWCGIPLEDHLYMNYAEPTLEQTNDGHTKIAKLLNLIQFNLSELRKMRPSSSGSIGILRNGYKGNSWGWALHKQNTTNKLPLVLFYEKNFIQAVKNSLDMKKNPNFMLELTVPSSSLLYKIPLLSVNQKGFTDLADKRFQGSCESFYFHSKALVEVENALGQLDILFDAIEPSEIPKSVQLFIDTIVLSKQIPIQEAQRRCFEEFDVDDEFWKDIEQHVGKIQWEELKRFHYQHEDKRQKLNVKRPLEQFLDAFSEAFDEDWKLKMMVRLKWAKKVV